MKCFQIFTLGALFGGLVWSADQDEQPPATPIVIPAQVGESPAIETPELAAPTLATKVETETVKPQLGVSSQALTTPEPASPEPASPEPASPEPASPQLRQLSKTDSSNTLLVKSDTSITLTASVADSSTTAEVAQRESALTDSTNNVVKAGLNPTFTGSAESKISMQPTSPLVAPSLKQTAKDSIRDARRKKILGQVKISKIQTAKDLGDGYKSPKKALFFSLALPGAGQLYVGNSNWTQARGAGYLIAEVLLWVGFYHFTVNRYEAKNLEARRFVQRNYDLNEYESNTFLSRNQAVGSDASADSIFTRRYLSQRNGFCEAVFGSDFANAESSCSSLSANQNYPKWDRVAEFEELAILLERDDFVLGWEDAALTELDLQLDDNAYVELGQSELLSKYRKKRQQARNYADMQPLFISGILLNHIISAVDAAWSAHSYNQSKVQKKLAWQERVHIQSSWGPNFNRGIQWQGFLQASYSF